MTCNSPIITKSVCIAFFDSKLKMYNPRSQTATPFHWIIKFYVAINYVTNTNHELTDTPASILQWYKRSEVKQCLQWRHFNATFTARACDSAIVMLTVSSCSTQVCKVLVLLLQSDVDPHIETRGIGGLSGGFTLLCI